jgi:hypothetical protein
MCNGKDLGSAAGFLLGGPLGLLAGNMLGDSLIDKPKEALDLQKQANADNKAAMQKQSDLADQANNKANARTADIAGISGANALDAKGGQSGTMITGPQGVDPNTLMLGKKTLLGG